MKLARIAKALPPRSEPKNSQFFLPMAKGFTAVSGATTPTYDSNGNLTTDENNYRFVYDAWNKVVQVKNSSNVVIVSYGRDALHRHVTDTVGSTVTDRFFSSDWQLLETKVGSNTVSRNVWSPVYVDALVLRDRDTDANGTLDERLYGLHDANWNTTALVNTSGTAQERYTYTPFGQVTFRDSSGSTLSSSAKDWVFLHQGGERIAAGDYEFRNRVYSPSLGRWLSNDPLGFEAGDQNWYRAIGNNPGNGLDPSGLDWLLGGLFGQNTNHLPYRPDPFKPSKNPQKKPEGPRNPNEIQSGELDQYSQIAGITWKSNTDWYSAVGEQVGPHAIEVAVTIGGYLIPGTFDEYFKNFLKLKKLRIVDNKIVDQAGKVIPEEKLPGIIKELEQEIGKVGLGPKNPITAKNGTRITGYTKHGLDRAIGDGGKRAGASPSSIIDALKNPIKIEKGTDKLGRPFETFTGQNARVVVNPDSGQIVSVNPLGRGGVR